MIVSSGRSEELVDEILTGFTEDSGIDIEVRYGDTAELATTIITSVRAVPRPRRQVLGDVPGVGMTSG